MALTLGQTLRGIRERGLENIFQRFYSFYQVKATDCADPQAMGRAKIKPESLGYSEEFDFADVYTPFGGEDSGFFFPPYEDDDVYVTFDHGDVSSPMIMGSFWKTRGAKKPSETGLPAEFVNTTTDADGNDVGVAPTVRGIKVRTGSGLAFDETEDKVYVELWSGQTQGIGKRAIKNHRVRLDNTKDAGQVVIATFGDENPNAEAASDDDSNTERDKKELEGRLRHQILMRDTTDDRFVQIKTIGTDDDKKFHQFLMSDKKSGDERVVRIKSAEEHFFEIDDAAETSTWSVKDGFRWLLDQKNKLMQGVSPGGRKITFDDQNEFMTLESPDGQTFKFDTDETLLEDTEHDINVKGSKDINVTGEQNINIESTVDTNLTVTGAFNIEVGQDWTSRVMASLVLLITGDLNIEAATVTIDSAQVQIGQGALQKLMNEAALAAFNAHTHQYLLPLHPVASIPTATPLVPMVVGTHTTNATTAG